MRFFGGLFAALFGLAACNDAGGREPLADGDERPSDAGAGEGGSSDGATDGVTGGDGTDGADAACGTVAPPHAWSSWIMPNPVRSGLPNPASYTVSDSGNQVTDTVTGLTWQRNLDTLTYTWDDAKQLCACAIIDGIGGWRLPSRIELVSITDWTTSGPSIDSNAFPGTPSESFWSSTMLSSATTLAYLVYFANGHTSYSDPGYAYHVRCVRGQEAPPTAPPERYTIANGTVYDTVTKLTWQQEFPPSLYAWADAKAYCSALSLDGTGWRLPATNEIQTIVDESTNPAIFGAAFPMTPSEYFWTSSVVVEDTTRAWTAFFTNGSTYSFGETVEKNVRCVR
jgi:Protein of unknown function (DUF1566)